MFLECSKLRFTYPDSAVNVLDQLSFTVTGPGFSIIAEATSSTPSCHSEHREKSPRHPWRAIFLVSLEMQMRWFKVKRVPFLGIKPMLFVRQSCSCSAEA